MSHKLILYNTINKKREIFRAIDPNIVKMYVCGPTVYDHPHLGNARSVVVYDILFRILNHIFGANKVMYVRNITDIDDKIIARAKELNISISQLTRDTTQDFHHAIEYLNCIKPSFEPKATEHINDMIHIIQILIDRNFAYESNGHIYFNVMKFVDYNQLSNRKFDKMLEGVRIELDPDKQNEKDFVLWKSAEDINDSITNYSSPWGMGRPGWHIECSAMSHKYLGENFDIHGGGADLIFPHHSNEIAQSRCAFEGSNFANFWVHNGFLTVNGEKMSKSLGNFTTVKDLIDKLIPGEVIKLFFMSVNYRHPIDYNEKSIGDSHKMLDYWYRALEGINIENLVINKLNTEFLDALLDDMNVPLAIKVINDLAKKIHNYTVNSFDYTEKDTIAAQMLACANFLGLLTKTHEQWFNVVIDDNIEKLINLRIQAKENKDFALADELREKLLANGIIIEDKTDGTYVVRKLST